MKPKHFLLSSAIILVTYILFTLSLYYFIPNESSRGLFGDMFGALNTLFSGLAFLGLLYTIYLQNQEINTSKYELKFNRLIDILGSQATFFNSSFNDYNFVVHTEFPDRLLKMHQALDHYSSIKDNPESMNNFLYINGKTITEMTTFISETVGFVNSLITKENFSPSDKMMLEKLFSRNIHNKTIDFISLSVDFSEYLKQESESKEEEFKELSNYLSSINTTRLAEIISFLNFKNK